MRILEGRHCFNTGHIHEQHEGNSILLLQLHVAKVSGACAHNFTRCMLAQQLRDPGNFDTCLMCGDSVQATQMHANHH